VSDAEDVDVSSLSDPRDSGWLVSCFGLGGRCGSCFTSLAASGTDAILGSGFSWTASLRYSFVFVCVLVRESTLGSGSSVAVGVGGLGGFGFDDFLGECSVLGSRSPALDRLGVTLVGVGGLGFDGCLGAFVCGSPLLGTTTTSEKLPILSLRPDASLCAGLLGGEDELGLGPGAPRSGVLVFTEDIDFLPDSDGA